MLYVCGANGAGKSVTAAALAAVVQPQIPWLSSSFVWGKVAWPELAASKVRYLSWWYARRNHRDQWVKKGDQLIEQIGNPAALVKLHFDAGNRVYDGVRRMETLRHVVRLASSDALRPRMIVWVGREETDGLDYDFDDLIDLAANYGIPFLRVQEAWSGNMGGSYVPE